MNQDLKKLISNSIILFFPIFLWCIIVVVVDPFNYFEISNFISKNSKTQSAEKLNSLLFNCIKFKNDPKANLIIGDSRIRKINEKEAKILSGKDYFKFYANATKLNEMLDIFDFANSLTKIEHAIIGVNFNLYNDYSYSNRVNDVKKIIKNPLLYIFNINTLETVLLALKHEFFSEKKKIKRNKKDFWKYNLSTVAKNHYSKWKHPKNLLHKLKKTSSFCKQKKIKLTFLILPHHVDFHSQLKNYNLYEEEREFKQEISKMAETIDYDYLNDITSCYRCFTDPIHTNDSISSIIFNEIIKNKYIIGKVISRSH